MHTYKQENGTISRPRRALWPVVACLFLLTTVACSQTDVFADTTEGFFHMVLNHPDKLLSSRRCAANVAARIFRK